MTVKLKTPSNGSVSLTPQDTASDVVVTVPSTAGSFVTADSSGNVGIGTSSPSYMLHISGATPIIGLTDTDTGADSYISANSPTGSLIISADENNEAASTVMTFRTNGIERMRIDPTGDLLVGTTSGVSGAAVSGVQISTPSDTSGRISVGKTLSGSAFAMIFYHNGTFVGSIAYSNTATTYNTSSDYRLKENIQPMQNALATVAQLNPVTYTWKADGSDGQGFIAHELQAIVPDCVTGEKDAVDAEGKPVYQGVDTSFLVATLTAAIQEQQAIINSLQDRITALENA